MAIGGVFRQKGTEKIPVALGVSFAVGLYLIIHIYTGIRHDGILYTGQALLHLFPENYRSDLFFVFGSQDQFSIFSYLYAPVIQFVGASKGAILLLALSLLVFFYTAFILLKEFVSRYQLWFGLFFLAGFSTYYGGKHVFSFAEPFLTARSYAEPLCLLSLLFLLRGRFWVALMLAITAAVFHPLIALPVLVIWWIFRSLENPKYWSLGIVGLVIPLLAALFGIVPFNHLLNSFDAEWLSIISEPNKNVFILQWNPYDWPTVIYDIVILVLAFHNFCGKTKILLLSVLLVGIGGMAISFLGVDILKNVLLTQLQLWRSQWVMHFFAVSLTPVLVSRMLKQGDSGRLVAWLFVTTLILIFHPVSFILMALAIFLMWLNQKYPVIISKKISLLLRFSCIIAIVIISINSIKFSLNNLEILPWDRAINPYLAFALSTPAATALFMVVFFWLSKRQTISKSYISVFVFFTLILGILNWDQRTSWAKYLENGLNQEHPFKNYIMPDNQVCWQNNLLSTWLILKRSNYFAEFQAAGLLFNRATALEYAKRNKVFEILVIQEQLCSMLNLLNKNYDCKLNIETVQEVCRNSPKLDFFILQSELNGFVEDKWVFKPERIQDEIPFYLYSCDKLRQSS